MNMKKILLLSFLTVLVTLMFSAKVNAATYMYTKRDAILRNGYTNADDYGPSSILKDGVRIAVIKGTKVKVLGKVNDRYYKVVVEADNYYYLKDRTGYIIAKSLTSDKVDKDPASERGLSVSDKTALLKNVMTLLQASELSDGNINILYPTPAAVGGEKQNTKTIEGKDVLRTAGYNFVTNGTPFKSIRTLNNGHNYYLSCSAFVGAIYNGTFGIDVTKPNGALYWSTAYQGYGTTDAKLFRVVKSTKTAGKKLAERSEMQIGDSISGTINKDAKPSNSNYRYAQKSGHIMLYIGDSIIAHSTVKGLTLSYADRQKNKVSNYYLVPGTRTTINNSTNANVEYGHRFDKAIYLVRINEGVKKERNRIMISENKKKFDIVSIK